VLRDLEDLAATERAVYEPDLGHDQVMNDCPARVGLSGDVDPRSLYPCELAHGTWERLAPFFQPAGLVRPSQQIFSGEVRNGNFRH
jgi:hypothetical protein